MFRKISLFFATLTSLSIVACDQNPYTDAQADAAASVLHALAKGDAALEACIASQCETLNIDGMRLEDYAAINDLTHVKILMASRTNISDLTTISGMHQLTELHITNTDIRDLSSLSNFPNLKVLHFDIAAEGVDITSIGQLTGLKELALGALGPNDDASFIQNMRQLENLVISWRDGEADISILNHHPSLKNVDIGGALPMDQSALLSMPRLEAIHFSHFFTLHPELRQLLTDRGVYSEPLVVIVC